MLVDGDKQGVGGTLQAFVRHFIFRKYFIVTIFNWDFLLLPSFCHCMCVCVCTCTYICTLVFSGMWRTEVAVNVFLCHWGRAHRIVEPVDSGRLGQSLSSRMTSAFPALGFWESAAGSNMFPGVVSKLRSVMLEWQALHQLSCVFSFGVGFVLQNTALRLLPDML